MVSRVLLIDELELELERIDLNLVLSRIVLQNRSEEALGEEEARQPEDLRRLLFIDPLTQCHYAKGQVSHIACQRFHGRVRDFEP